MFLLRHRWTRLSADPPALVRDLARAGPIVRSLHPMPSGAGPARYDTIGRTYTATRRTDPRIAAQIHAALGSASTIINVGAGTGSYEPADRTVVAVEPSSTMLDQRLADAAPAVQATAEHLPFADGAFDAAMAVLTVHHWSDEAQGLRELRRVADRQVILLFDAAISATYWLLDDYFPESLMQPTEQHAPTPDDIARRLDVRRIQIVPVPADCTDGFAGAYWRRPEAHLDPAVLAGMSCIAQLDPEVVERSTARLAADLADGRWDERYGHLRTRDTIDLGYRLVVCG
jgi:SAM-dependent methyltransferase